MIDLSLMQACPRRPARPDGPRRRWGHLGRFQLRHPRLRTGHHRWDHFHDRHRRPDPGRRDRLSDPRLRAVHRQPALGRGGHRRRAGSHSQRAGATRICSGRCAAAAATSAWSPPSSSSCTRSTTSTWDCSSTSSTTAGDLLRFFRDSSKTHPRPTALSRLPDRPTLAVHPRRPPRRHLLSSPSCTGPDRSIRARTP